MRKSGSAGRSIGVAAACVPCIASACGSCAPLVDALIAEDFARNLATALGPFAVFGVVHVAAMGWRRSRKDSHE